LDEFPRGRRSIAVWAIVAAALALRLGVSFLYGSHLSVGKQVARPRSEGYYVRTASIELTDSQQYLLLADNLRKHAFFSWDGTTPVTFRTPGYPLLLALLGNNMALIIIVQALLSAGTVLLVFLLGRRWFGELAGLVAAALLAADLTNIEHAGTIMTEPLFVFAVVLATWMFARGTGERRGTSYELRVTNDKRRMASSSVSPGVPGGSADGELRVAKGGWWRATWWLAGSGLVLGFAALVRPIAILAVVPYGLVLLLRRNWRGLALMVAVFAVLPLAWVARNYVHYRHVSYSSIGGYNLFYYNAAAMEADRTGVTFPDARIRLEEQFAANLRGDNPLDLSGQLAREGVRRMLADPVRYAKVYAMGLGRIAFGVKSDEIVLRVIDPQLRLATAMRVIFSGEFGSGAKVVTVVLAVAELLMVLAGLAGTFVAVVFRRNRAVLLPFLIGAYYLLAAAPLPDGRFRVPAMPFFYLAAASLLAGRRVRGQAEAA
jgi:hypothetical protein